jgi:hypothetical protein
VQVSLSVSRWHRKPVGLNHYSGVNTL